MSDGSDIRLVLDVGKTNVKIHIFDRHLISVESQSLENGVIEEGLYPHVDVETIWTWMMEVLRGLSDCRRISAIAVATHGATAALVDRNLGGNGLAMPILDYEWSGLDSAIGYDDVRPDFSETLSPDLPGGLNLGRQLYWQQLTYPEQFDAADAVLLYPQYWVYRLTGNLVSELTSLGCHTDLWRPSRGEYSSLVERQGWRSLFPSIVPAWEVVGPVAESVADQSGLAGDCRVHAGIHDSNASFLRYRLANPAGEFCVVSTGTWVVCMSAGSGEVAMDESRDMLANVDVFGNTIPCIRFMGGREYAEICARCSVSPSDMSSKADVERLISDGCYALPDFSGGSGPFGGRSPEIRGPVSSGGALASLYCALMIDYCLELLWSSGDVIIDGSFTQDPLLCGLLAQLRDDQAVFVSNDSAGTARGAAQLTDWSRFEAVTLTRCEATMASGLDGYRRRWRDLASNRL